MKQEVWIIGLDRSGSQVWIGGLDRLWVLGVDPDLEFWGAAIYIWCELQIRKMQKKKKNSVNGPQAFLLCSCCRPFHWRSHVKGHSCHHPPATWQDEPFLQPRGLKSLPCRFVEKACFCLKAWCFCESHPKKVFCFCSVSASCSISQWKSCESECHWCFCKEQKWVLTAIYLRVLPQFSPGGELLSFSTSRIPTKTFNGCHCLLLGKGLRLNGVPLILIDLAKIVLFSWLFDCSRTIYVIMV